MVKLLQENSQEEDYFSGNFLFSVPPEVWADLKRLAEVTETSFESLAMDYD